MVSAGGLARGDASWVETGTKWLVATKKLEPLFRARMLATLRKQLEAEELDAAVLARAEASLQAAAAKRWVIHVTRPDDRGPRTFLLYLARYVYRVAMDDRRLLRWEGDRVTFSTRGGKTKTLTGWEFARRFL